MNQLENLINTVRNVMGMGNMRLTKRMISSLKDLHKQGYAYDIIEKAYELSEGDIDWAMATIDFDSETYRFNYCLAIVKNNLNKAWRETDREKLTNKQLKEILKDLSNTTTKKITQKTTEISDSFAEGDKEWMR